jgi:peptidoglycan/LPS O-acetylase OafA/YrhL
MVSIIKKIQDMPTITYRPGIDGLRALAILSVFIFHLNKDFLPGGFVGVDVFFVISGFLITGIIYRECKEGRFDLVRFYQRRIARIFPAFFVVAIATLIAASQIYSPQDLASAGANLVAAALSVANFKSMLQGGYFEVSEDALPYLHYWSLAVEEQYYLIFPVFFLGAYKFLRLRIIPILIIFSVLSLGASFIFMKVNPSWAFFLLPSRAWELIVGGVLAIFVLDGRLPRNRFTCSLPGAGFVLVMISFFVVPEGPSFPGAWALLPVIGTMGILSNGNSNHRIEKILSWAPLVAIGKISFSLYLWHWPIFSMIDYEMYMFAEWLRVTLKILLSLLATVATYFLIEGPTRSFLSQQKHRRLSFCLALVMVASCSIIGLKVRQLKYINADASDIAKSGLVFGSSKSDANTVVLVGDSHGSMYGTLLKELVADEGGRFVCLSIAAADPLPRPGNPSPELWRNIIDVVERERPETVVLVCRWEDKLKNECERLDMAINDLSPIAGRIVLFTQPPILPSLATRANIRSKVASEPFFEEAEPREKRIAANAYVLGRSSSNVAVLDIAKFFEAGDGGIIFKSSIGKPFYHDSSHLSGFAASVIEKKVAELIR